MRFSDIIGQGEMKRRIFQMFAENRVPHALLLAGGEGTGKLPLALTLAQRLICQAPTPEGDPCGHCSDCRMAAQFVHPDIHYFFPVVKSGDSAVSDTLLPHWREQLNESVYFTRQQWLDRIGAERQQSLINVAEANKMLMQLSTISNLSGKHIVVMWQAEQLNVEAANKLLKIIEEPPHNVYFIFTSDHPEQLLSTIQSRLQRLDFPPLTEQDISEALQRCMGLQPGDARFVAHAAAGNFTKAVEQVTVNVDSAQFFDLFVLFMRLSYMRNVKELNEWALQLSQWGRERQKAFLQYAQRLIRENFISNFHCAELNYMNRKEAEFAVKFAPFINERNVIGLMEELGDAECDIAQNVNARMVFFDLALKTIVLLVR